MKYRPHKYQQKTVEFILSHPVAAIFLDMGMGKTSIALQAILLLMYDSFEVSKVLIIAPLRLARYGWVSEIKKWDDFSLLRYSVVVGTAAERLAALKADADVYIINRENIPWLVEKSGIPFDFDMVVIDELSSFKNWQSKRFKAFMKVRPKVKRIVGLTGTPVGSGGYMDLYGEIKVLDMGKRLGTIGQYRSWYFRPLATNGHIVYSYGLLPGADELINKKISEIATSMSAEDYLEMPEKNIVQYPVYLDDKERKVYEKMKNDLILQTSDGEVTAANAAALSGKLCQLANGAVYLDDGSVCEVHQKKLDALEDIIEAANGKQVIVVYYYRHDKERIVERLKGMKASFECLDSDESIERWNNKEFQICLLHPMSAGHGLNLQESGCDLICFFSTVFSYEAVQQTVCRIYRQGQKSKKVTIMHILTDKTIDEQIMKALDRGNTTHAALIDAVKSQF